MVYYFRSRLAKTLYDFLKSMQYNIFRLVLYYGSLKYNESLLILPAEAPFPVSVTAHPEITQRINEVS